MKKLISKEFGFAQNKITITDYFISRSNAHYIGFKVCKVNYSIYYDIQNGFYRLMIWKNPKIDK